jgi:hypothetical protein
MGFRRTWAVAVPAVAAALLVLAPASASAAGNGNGRSSNTVEFQAKADNGTETSTGPAGCQFGGTCNVSTTGTADVRAGNYGFQATYTSALAINYGAVTFPQPGEYCAPAAGTVHIVSNSTPGDSIDKTEQGQVCADTSAGASHTFTGTYTITGGSGRFSGATGSGSVRTTDDGAGNVTSSHEWGTITYADAK